MGKKIKDLQMLLDKSVQECTEFKKVLEVAARSDARNEALVHELKV